jgi:mono/diheme cytochrome c family protein
MPTGQQIYQHCAVCHGADAKGQVPLGAMLKTPPPDLTTLAKRHGGKFPDAYVASVLRAGVPIPAHGPAEMPI